MKYFFILILGFTLSASANELKRIELIVNDIQNIRAENDSCLKSLEEQTQINKTRQSTQVNEVEKYKKLLDEAKAKNISLVLDLNKSKNYFEEQLENLNVLLKSKDDTIDTLLIENKKVILCTEDNVFPTLIMKENKVIQKKVYFRAKTFELLHNANIFNSIKGKKIEEWKEKSIFTSNVKTQNWIKITGYFIEDKWQRSQKELWIKIKNTKKR